MTRILRLVVTALTLSLAAGPWPAAAGQTHLTAAPDGAELDRAARGDLLLVDIRQPEEWRATGVVPGALLLPHDGDPAAFLAALRPHLDGRPVALICRTGNRTARAAALLAPALDVPVIDISGGIVRLMAEGYRPAAPTRAQGCRTC